MPRLRIGAVITAAIVVGIPVVALATFEWFVAREGAKFSDWYDRNAIEPMSAEVVEIVWRENDGGSDGAFESMSLPSFLFHASSGRERKNRAGSLAYLVSRSWMSEQGRMNMGKWHGRNFVLTAWIERNMTPATATVAAWSLFYGRHAEALFDRGYAELTIAEVAVVIAWARRPSELRRCVEIEESAAALLRGTGAEWTAPRYRVGHRCGGTPS